MATVTRAVADVATGLLPIGFLAVVNQAATAKVRRQRQAQMPDEPTEEK